MSGGSSKKYDPIQRVTNSGESSRDVAISRLMHFDTGVEDSPVMEQHSSCRLVGCPEAGNYMYT
jgi:hypothetical protein